MALSRKLLESLGLESAKVETIIEAHGETVSALKAQIEQYKGDAEKFTATQTQLEEAQKELESLKNNGGDDWQKKYESEHKAFEDYKTEQSNKEILSNKKKAYKELLKGSGISEQVIDELAELAKYDELTLDEDGKITEAEKLSESIKSKYSKFIVDTNTQGAQTVNPPSNNGQARYSREDISKMSAEEINKNWEAIKASL